MARSEVIVREKDRTRLDEIDDAAISGTAALWLRGCRRLGRPERFELLVGRARAPAISGATVRITRELPPDDIEEIDGIPTLVVPRLLAELSVSVTDVQLTAVTDDLLGMCDAVWAAAHVAVELDGLRFHAAPGQYRRDRGKDRRLGAAGWLVLRYTWQDVVERPDDVAAEINAAITSRRSR